jgi:hypothetical protein
MQFQPVDRPCHVEQGFWEQTYQRWVAEGVRARTWVTCASTVAATSVRMGLRSRVGVLVGAGEPQAARQAQRLATDLDSLE